MLFWPDVGDHDGLAVTSNSILKEIGQLTLSVWNVILFVVTGGDDNLLEEGKRLVDVVCFFHSTGLIQFLSSFISSKINKMKLRNNDLFGALSSSFALDIDSVDTVGSG